MLKLILPTMTRGHCVSVITKVIEQTDSPALVEIDLASQRVRVETTDDCETIDSAVAEAGHMPCSPKPGVSAVARLRRSAPPSYGYRQRGNVD